MQEIQGDDKGIIFRRTRAQGMLSANKMLSNSQHFQISSSLCISVWLFNEAKLSDELVKKQKAVKMVSNEQLWLFFRLSQEADSKINFRFCKTKGDFPRGGVTQLNKNHIKNMNKQ